MSSSHKPGRARKVLGVLGSVVGVTVTFVAGVAAAAVIHLDVPATRRLVATQANGILKGQLQGEIHVASIGHLGLDGIDGVRVQIKDPTGIQVLDVDGVKVKVRGVEAARSALFGKGPIEIQAPLVSVNNIDANLDTDGSQAQNLRVANAFQPKDQTPPKPNEPPGRGVKVNAPDIRINHVWAHGYPPGGQPVDADLRALAAHASLDPQRVDAVLDKVGLEARAMPRGANPVGLVGGKFSMPLEGDKPPMVVEASFDGKVGNIPTTVKGGMNGTRIDAVVDAHDATGNDTSLLVTEVAIHDALTVHAEAHGDLPRIEGKANVKLGEATVDATATVVTGESTRIKGDVQVRNVDAQKIQASAPPTNMSLDASGDVSIGDKGVSGTASVDTKPGLVAHQQVPAMQIRANFAGMAAHATLDVPDPSMKTSIVVDVTPRTDRPDGQMIVAKVTSKIPDLHKVPEIGPSYGGSASIDADAKLMMPEKAIAANAKVSTWTVRDHELALGHATLEAKASGTLDRPVVDAQVHAADLATGTLPIAGLDASAHVVVDGSNITITGVNAEARRPASEPIKVSAKQIAIAGPSLRVDGAVITGVGDPIKADVVKSGNDIDGTIDAPSINLRLLSRLAGQEKALAIETGTLSIGGKVTLHGQNVKADLQAEVKSFNSKDVRNANAKLDTRIDGRDVALNLKASVGDAGDITVSTDKLVLAGPAADPNAWKGAHGKLNLDGAVDMQKLQSILPPDSIPLSDLRGMIVVQGRVGRDEADAPPEIQLHAHTLNLVAAGPSVTPPKQVGNVTVQQVAPWRVTGIDIGVDVRNDALSGLTNVAFRVTDAHGMLVAFDSKTTLPYKEIIANPKIAKERAFNAPISAMMIIPPRRLDELPSIVGLKDTQGTVEAQLEATGTVVDPRVRFIMKGRGMRAPQMPKDTKADADIALDYDGKDAKLAIKSANQGKDLLTVSAVATAKAKDFLFGRPDGKTPEWTASAKAHLASFPLESVPQIAQQRVKGKISGDISLDDLHKDAKVTGHIALEKFKVAKVEYEKGNVDIAVGGGKMSAKLRIDQKDGYIDASAASGMNWGAEVVPTLDDKTPLTAKLDAKNFHAAAIQPFVASALPTLDGNIDANASAAIVPGQAGAQLEGKVVFTNGTIQPAALGEELRNVRATVTLAKDGSIKVDDVSASGISGEIHAKATAKLDGFRLADAKADIDIPKNKAFDFALQGQPLGEMYGTISVTAKQSVDGKVTSIGVDIPNLNVELPQSNKTGVESLDAKENIHIGAYREQRMFVKLPMDKKDTQPPADQQATSDPSRLDVDVKIGRIQVSRGNQARVGLAGALKVSVGLDTRISGEIHALDGWADVQGKKFTVEKASITFDGKPDINPVVIATAQWNAADGSKVYADFVGPVKTGKVTLRSEPARPQNEVLALILFGTADGANPTPQASDKSGDSTTKTAVGLGGGIAAEGLTNALDDMAGIQATVRIDTTSSTNPRPEVEFQVSPKVAIAFGHVLGTPPITEPDTNLAKLEYRFHRNWSFETEVGDKGKAQIDAIWQKRY